MASSPSVCHDVWYMNTIVGATYFKLTQQKLLRGGGIFSIKLETDLEPTTTNVF